ncbi:hypothetical protein FIU86_21630 (plasmid) [Roseovarius sp. THAF9]|nr:hypothetical protein FIU86_21630 [Roseovarius sp. THAF9]
MSDNTDTADHILELERMISGLLSKGEVDQMSVFRVFRTSRLFW